MLGREAALLQERHRERIPERELHGRRRGGSEPFGRASFAFGSARQISAWRPSVESPLAVIAISGTRKRLA